MTTKVFTLYGGKLGRRNTCLVKGNFVWGSLLCSKTVFALLLFSYDTLRASVGIFILSWGVKRLSGWWIMTGWPHIENVTMRVEWRCFYGEIVWLLVLIFKNVPVVLKRNDWQKSTLFSLKRRRDWLVKYCQTNPDGIMIPTCMLFMSQCFNLSHPRTCTEQIEDQQV